MNKKIIGKSPAIQELLRMIQKVAASKTNILVIGESGTGKELVARMIHDSSPMKSHPFVPVNCGAIPETLIESEMFGHKKGSFTGAVSEKMGLFEAANGGTLFLDEVGELPLPMQVKLLRALQERVIRKVGGTDDVRVDVRIIAATNRDLEAAVSKGTFREDLFYRLNVILIKTPPLRERKEDIKILANEFLKNLNEKYQKKVANFSPQALQALENYDWPGNVRELENIAERAITLENSDIIHLESLPTALQHIPLSAQKSFTSLSHSPHTIPPPQPSAHSTPSLPPADFSRGSLQLDEIINQVERFYLLRALEHSQGVKRKAADLLGITFRSIRYRLNKLGIHSSNEEADSE